MDKVIVTNDDVGRIEEKLRNCHKILNALGDETRRHLICMMLRGECSGSRVVDIAEKTNLSRPAVSHHMQILKDAGIVKSRKEGTCVYYYLDVEARELDRLTDLFADVSRVMRGVPDRSGDD